MLIFCEDCGAKHTIDDNEVIDESFKYRCDACDFLITEKSIPMHVRKTAKKSPPPPPVDPTMELTSSHEFLDFGEVIDDEKTQTLIMAAKDGRKVELTCIPEKKVEGNVFITPVSGFAFRVQVLAPEKVTGGCLDEYKGPGVIVTDTISNYQKKVGLSFSRLNSPR